MKRKLTPAMMKGYFSGKIKGENYERTVELFNRMNCHAKGDKKGYGNLIAERRPHESKTKLNYRKSIIVEVTKETLSKVFTELNKIRRADDWDIKYNHDEFPAIIPPEETLDKYCEENFPEFTSVTDWAFQVLLPKYGIDGNAVMVVMPKEFDIPETEFFKPVVYVYTSDHVIDFEEGSFAIIKSAEKHIYMSKDTPKQGEVWYAIDTERYMRFVQINDAKEMSVDLDYVHGLGYMPARKTKGTVIDIVNENIIYESRFYGMVPWLDEAIREYSDLQAEIVQHIYSEKYVYSNQDCTQCKGAGYIKEGKDSVQVECPKCYGFGKVVFASPYNATYVIRPSENGEGSVPTPPVAYVQKDTAIAILQDQRVDKHKYSALSAVNMEFLCKTPANQSGVAKDYDQQPLNTLVNSVCEDLVGGMDWVYKVTNDLRYKLIVIVLEERKKFLPNINTPAHFAFSTPENLINEVKAARDGNVAPFIVNMIEQQYVNKKFNADSEIKRLATFIIELDPMGGKTIDTKITELQNKGCSELDFFISCNILTMLKTAMEADKEFENKTYAERVEAIKLLAEPLMTEIKDKAAEDMVASLDIMREGAPAEEKKPVPPIAK